MEIFLYIALAAFGASVLTFFSGFGLGTLLTPVFMVCGFQLEIAVALTAVVHLLNNLFKLLLLGKHFNKSVLLRFGITAVIGALIGSMLLSGIDTGIVLHSYSLNGHVYNIELLKTLVAAVMIYFSLMEIVPAMNFEAGEKWLPLGGLLSGFFGGLSGHQGALRSAFLLKLKLPKESFIATGVLIACMIDVARLSIYTEKFALSAWQEQWQLLLTATLSAFAGAIIGQQILKKITITFLQFSVSVLIILFSFALALGWV